jgi:hypothetical protein
MVTFSRANRICPVPIEIEIVIMSASVPFSAMLTPVLEEAVSGPILHDL